MDNRPGYLEEIREQPLEVARAYLELPGGDWARVSAPKALIRALLERIEELEAADPPELTPLDALRIVLEEEERLPPDYLYGFSGEELQELDLLARDLLADVDRERIERADALTDLADKVARELPGGPSIHTVRDVLDYLRARGLLEVPR